MNVSLNPCWLVHDILNFMINVNNVTENNIGSIPVQKLKNTKKIFVKRSTLSFQLKLRYRGIKFSKSGDVIN